MNKSELIKLIKEVFAECDTSHSPVKQDDDTIHEAKGLSGMKKASEKLDNTQMGATDKTITSTSEPKEKEEGKKLPVVKKPAQPKLVKEMVMNIIREVVDEYRTKGALGSKNPNRTAAVKATGKNYKAKGMSGMGRPKSINTSGPAGLEISMSLNGTPWLLDYDFLNNPWPSAKRFLETDIMAELPNEEALKGKISDEVYQVIEKAKEDDLDGNLNDTNNKITLYYDTPSHQLRAKRVSDKDSLKEVGATKNVNQEIEKLLKQGKKVFSAAIGRVGEVDAVEQNNVYIKLRRGRRGVTSFNSGDAVVINPRPDGTYVIVNTGASGKSGSQTLGQAVKEDSFNNMPAGLKSFSIAFKTKFTSAKVNKENTHKITSFIAKSKETLPDEINSWLEAFTKKAKVQDPSITFTLIPGTLQVFSDRPAKTGEVTSNP